MKTRSLSFLAAATAALALPSSLAAQVPSVINVEIDYMVGERGHTHRPSQAAMDAVVQMFACHGITLNLVIDEAIPEVEVMQCAIPGFAFYSCGGPNSFSNLKANYAGLGALAGWHYCIFGHQYDSGEGTGKSGIAEINGNDLAVTLFDFGGLVNGTDFQQAATFAHELGHNLGLHHSTPGSFSSSGPYAPNYASIMSYQYQLNGVRSQMECLGLLSSAHLFKDLDYSNGRLPYLTEASMPEGLGVGIRAVDWNCDGVVNSANVSKDLDAERNWCLEGGGSSLLADYDDWANIVDSTDSPYVYTDALVLDVATCISLDEYEAIRDAGGLDAPNPSLCLTNPTTPLVSVEACRSGEMYFVDVSNPTGVLGNGVDPFGSLGLALLAAPDTSVLYLQPGTYANGSTDVILDRPLTLTGPGTAIVDP